MGAGAQALMLAAKLETWEEAKVILLFHVTGTAIVSFGKLSSWYLLLIISYAMVALVSRPVAADDEAAGLARVSQ